MGHVGAALAAKRARQSVGLLVLLLATYGPDWADTALCLTRANGSNGMLSHSLPAVGVLAVLGFSIYTASTRDWKGGLVVGSVVVSHMLLDWITGEKPTWPGGPRVGLQLYAHPIADFSVEGILIICGVALYARTLPDQRSWADARLMLAALLALQVGVDVGHLLIGSLQKC
ncbi:MAG: metal-dependent hydrolase [Gemmatimonadaceae bacterium]